MRDEFLRSALCVGLMVFFIFSVVLLRICEERESGRLGFQIRPNVSKTFPLKRQLATSRFVKKQSNKDKTKQNKRNKHPKFQFFSSNLPKPPGLPSLKPKDKRQSRFVRMLGPSRRAILGPWWPPIPWKPWVSRISMPCSWNESVARKMSRCWTGVVVCFVNQLRETNKCPEKQAIVGVVVFGEFDDNLKITRRFWSSLTAANNDKNNSNNNSAYWPIFDDKQRAVCPSELFSHRKSLA